MPSTLRRQLLSIAALAWFIFPFALSPARAQAEITLETLKIELWPEFDQPSMLVIYTGKVSGDPREVNLRFAMPQGATFNAAAYEDEAGALVDAQVTTGSGVISMTSPNGTFHVEFYDPALQASGENRQYAFTWPGDYAVSTLAWSIQQPPHANSFTVEPAADKSENGRFDLTYHELTQTGLAAGQSGAVSVTYTRSDAVLTVELLNAAPDAGSGVSSGAGTVQPAGEALEPATVLTIALTIVVVAGVGVFWYTRLRPQRGERVRPVSSKKRQEGKAPPRFCSQCGEPVANPREKFCRNCGAALR